MKREIEYLITSNDQVFKPTQKDSLDDECTIKHLGRQIYLVGYFDFNKQGYSKGYEQNKVNKYMILFPADIKRIIFK